MMKVTSRLATIPRNTPAITPPAIGPTFDLLFVPPELGETMGAELVADWVELRVVADWVELVADWVELVVAWVELAVGRRADDSRPPASA
jgi:hypothetical protein